MLQCVNMGLRKIYTLIVNLSFKLTFHLFAFLSFKGKLCFMHETLLKKMVFSVPEFEPHSLPSHSDAFASLQSGFIIKARTLFYLELSMAD